MLTRLATTTAAAALIAASAHAQELTVGAANVSDYLDPGRDHSNVGSQFFYNSFDTLIGKNHDARDAEWQPALATEWTLVEPTVMELRLREGVVFHNGEKMTADDVVFSLNRMFQADFPPYQVRSRDRLDNFTGAEKVDDYTVRITVEREEPLWGTLLNLQQLMIIPEDYTKGLAGDPQVAEHDDFEAFSLAPVGTGPYRIAEFVPGERVVYERFDDFWGEAAPLERVTVRQVPETASRITALRTGEADLRDQHRPRPAGSDRVRPHAQGGGRRDAALPRSDHEREPSAVAGPANPPGDQPRHRPRRVERGAVAGEGRRPLDPHDGGVRRTLHAELETFEYDPERARELLEEAGYDGFTITYDTAPTYYTNALLAAQVIMEMWEAVGINGRIDVADPWTGDDPEMMARNWSNPMQGNPGFTYRWSAARCLPAREVQDQETAA